MTAISATNLTKHYGDVKAVRGIDLAVEAGSIHGFVGPNGAGKSTTMEMLVGLVTPTVGEAHVAGEPAGSQAALAAVGFAPQDPVFYESMTGRSYLRYVAALADVEGSRSERVAELLDWLDLADAAGEAVSGYSGGMRRRLGLAQAMVHEPAVLILDEPTAELDPQGRVAIIDTLADLAEAGTTVFVSSHILAELEQFVDAVTVINDGRIVTAGSLDAIRDTVAEAYVVESTDDAALEGRLAEVPSVEGVERGDSGLQVRVEDRDAFEHALPSVLAEAGVGLRALRRDTGLEEAFLDMVEEGGD